MTRSRETESALAAAVVSGFASSASVSSTVLHAKTREALDRVRDGACLAVTHYNEVDAYLVPPAQLSDMAARLNEADIRERELRDTLPLVLAAARAGVAIPSESLERIVPTLDQSWRAVAEFAASFSLRLSRGEHGEPLTRGRLHAAAAPIEEFGEDDDLILDA
jgi:antitoxin (DNA-binding transcriptional repressor) of toxin-antitoxin stability system